MFKLRQQNRANNKFIQHVELLCYEYLLGKIEIVQGGMEGLNFSCHQSFLLGSLSLNLSSSVSIMFTNYEGGDSRGAPLRRDAHIS